jgi:hypothetical protein
MEVSEGLGFGSDAREGKAIAEIDSYKQMRRSKERRGWANQKGATKKKRKKER